MVRLSAARLVHFLSALDSQELLLENNQLIATLLIDEVDELVVGAENGAQVATEASSQSIFTGRILLIAISLTSVGGALLVVLISSTARR